MLSLIRVRRVRFINETDANIFKTLMIISQKVVKQRFLFNLLISYEFPIAFFSIVIPSKSKSINCFSSILFLTYFLFQKMNEAFINTAQMRFILNDSDNLFNFDTNWTSRIDTLARASFPF